MSPQVVATEPGRIRFREVSCFCSQSCDCFSPKEFVFADRDPEESAETIKVGTWVLVDYDGDLYPGTVTQVGLRLRVESREVKCVNIEFRLSTCNKKGGSHNHIIIVLDKLLHLILLMFNFLLF